MAKKKKPGFSLQGIGRSGFHGTVPRQKTGFLDGKEEETRFQPSGDWAIRFGDAVRCQKPSFNQVEGIWRDRAWTPV